MLIIKVSGEEGFNDETNEFVYGEDLILCFEHSLLSVSKWESKHQIPFLGKEEKTSEQIFDYLKFMLVGKNANEDALNNLTPEDISKINDYIQSSESATTFNDLNSSKSKGRSEVITSELIYYWMVAFNIPFECETWHLNRLFALIQICNIKNSPQKKMSRSELASRNRVLNDQRRQQLRSRG